MIIRLASVEGLDQWLDDKVGPEYQEDRLAQDWARISKIGEELGETIQAFIGFTAQNPRKGFTHTQQQVLDEIADTVFTGILAIQHFTKDRDATVEILEERWNYRTQKWQECL